jgi:hypothetical protein
MIVIFALSGKVVANGLAIAANTREGKSIHTGRVEGY